MKYGKKYFIIHFIEMRSWKLTKKFHFKLNCLADLKLIWFFVPTVFASCPIWKAKSCFPTEKSLIYLLLATCNTFCGRHALTLTDKFDWELQTTKYFQWRLMCAAFLRLYLLGLVVTCELNIWSCRPYSHPDHKIKIHWEKKQISC